MLVCRAEPPAGLLAISGQRSPAGFMAGIIMSAIVTAWLPESERELATMATRSLWEQAKIKIIFIGFKTRCGRAGERRIAPEDIANAARQAFDR